MLLDLITPGSIHRLNNRKKSPNNSACEHVRVCTHVWLSRESESNLNSKASRLLERLIYFSVYGYCYGDARKLAKRTENS